MYTFLQIVEPAEAEHPTQGLLPDWKLDTVLRATACCFGFCGLAACSGASTTTL
ncbi:hypothetical protein M2175_004900 [Bradyrhizobium elkanii]|uniref:hypothetical protein n=1 Tax=Bradyrhizobium TaxID=374 RepID=UPI0012DB3C3A|nr:MULTISPECIES: hypothetical protein [Bradyrhizobium]MCS3929869.1 hypothetical protein [Bradyrhizobium elkanii]MCS3970426.1 hypothetical protein [Bradyrhizobium japonicum]